MLCGEYDSKNAILTFQAGTGGTEAQDWTQMLYRMYTRWAERHGYQYNILDYQDGDEAGFKFGSNVSHCFVALFPNIKDSLSLKIINP